MIYVVAMTREADSFDSRKWQMATFKERPDFKVGDMWEDPIYEITWKIKDIFRV
jgi:hypothetical protein